MESTGNRIYFIGINGIGMSGLAKIMKNKKYDVKGTDLSRNYVTEEMEKMGIAINNVHDGKNLSDVDMVIASSAIKSDNPEYKYAVDHDIRILKRGELLAMLLNDATGIAIAGTHGKTTTTSMMSQVMLDLDPTIVVGGVLPAIGSNSKVGNSQYFIAEADESDKSFLYMRPKYSIITNIEEDHMENYGTLENIKNAFAEFIGNTQTETIVCIDSPNVADMLNHIGKHPHITTYGVDNPNADVVAKDIQIKDGKVSFVVTIKGESSGRYTLSIPGRHNIQNALPIIYLANELGISRVHIKAELEKFRGSKRRYDVLYEKDNLKIIDDYAHHPSEIKATLSGAKMIETNPITVIFQPHRYSRVKFLLEEFADAFANTDEVILLPIYSAGEKDEFGVTIDDLYAKIQNANKRIEKDKSKIKEYVANNKNNRVYMFMGAGDISTLAHEVADSL